MTQTHGITWQRARFLRIWAVLALVWDAGVTVLFYGDMTSANVASEAPADGGGATNGETSREARTEISPNDDRSMAKTAMLALLPPAGTLVTGLALGWFVSRPKRQA